MLKIFPEFKYEYIQTQKSLYHLDSTISICCIALGFPDGARGKEPA